MNKLGLHFVARICVKGSRVMFDACPLDFIKLVARLCLELLFQFCKEASMEHGDTQHVTCTLFVQELVQEATGMMAFLALHNPRIVRASLGPGSLPV
jgi:hypothetical protein